MNNSLHTFLGLSLNNFTDLTVLEGDINRLSNFRFYNPFVIASWGTNVGTSKLKAK